MPVKKKPDAESTPDSNGADDSAPRGILAFILDRKRSKGQTETRLTLSTSITFKTFLRWLTAIIGLTAGTIIAINEILARI